MDGQDFEIIGTRPESGFRVRTDYFRMKRSRFKPRIDPTTGGPVAVVFANTDDRVDPKYVHWNEDPRDEGYGEVQIDRNAKPVGGA